MEVKYAVKLSITELFKIGRKCMKRYNGHLWKIQMWSDSCTDVQTYFSVRLVLGLVLGLG